MFDLRTPRTRERPALCEEDLLVRLATRGDRDAIAELIIRFGPMLVEEARVALGKRREHRAEDVVQDLAEALLRNKVEDFVGGRGDGLPFLRRTIRGLAEFTRRRRRALVAR